MVEKKGADGRDWYVLVPMGAIAFALAFWGFTVCADCNVQGPFAIVLKSFALIKGSANYTHPWQLLLAQWMVPLVAVLGFAKLVVTRIRRDVRLALAKRARNHVIVCGLGDTGRNVALAQHAAGRKVVVIDRDNDSATAHSLELAGIPVLKGDAADAHVLDLAGANKSSALVICCGSDAVNLEVALKARDLRQQKKKTSDVALRIYCEVREQWLLRTIAGSTANLSSLAAEFIAVNFYENGARELLNALSAKRKLLSVAEHPHLLIVGFGSMGLELLVQCVRSYFAIPGVRLAVTIIDQNAGAARDAIMQSFPALLDLADITFEGHAFGIDDDAQFADKIIAAKAPDMAFVATASDETNLRIGLIVRQRLDRAALFAVPVYARDQLQPELGSLVSQIQHSAAAIDRFVTFAGGGLLAGANVLERDPLDDLARAVHAVYAKRSGETHATPWDKLPERMKRSNRFFADHIAVKLAHFGFEIINGASSDAFTDAEVQVLAQMEHIRWTIEQRLDGWEYGAVRDDLIKHHLLLVAWDALPADARETNASLVRSIPQILAAAGLGMRRNYVGSAGAAVESADRTVVVARASDALSALQASHVWLRIEPGMTPVQMASKQVELGAAFDGWVDAQARLPNT